MFDGRCGEPALQSRTRWIRFTRSGETTIARDWDDRTRDWARALSLGQRAAVVRWQGRDRFYERVQRAYLGVLDDPDAIDVADTLLTVVSFPIPTDRLTWRGVRSAHSTFGVPADQLGRLAGAYAVLDRFLATSVDRDVALSEFTVPPREDGAVLMEITLKVGVRVAWLPPVGRPELAYQQELLVRPEMLQRIVGVDQSGSIAIVRVEVTPE